MIEQQLTLCSNGRAALSGYSGGLLLGYAHNTGVYRLQVACSGEWDGTTVRAFWHLPSQAEPLTTLVADGAVEVPALVTAQGGSGTVTFEGSDGTRTVTSASVPYTVLTNSGTTDPTLPEPGTPAWQQFLQQVKQELRSAASGLSDEERGLILALFQHAAYDNAEMLGHYNALAALWSGSTLPDLPDTPTTPDQPDTPDTPDTPSGSQTVPGETAVYELTEAKQFLPDSKQYIDTGVKLFEDISAQPSWTILVDADDFGRLKNLTTSPVMLHCGVTEDPRLSVMAWTNGAVVLDLYGAQTRLGWWGGSTTARWHAYLQIKGTQYRMGTDPENDAWQDIPSYTSSIAASLILGAYREEDGSISRYWDGTIRKFAVYNKILTSDQLKTFVEEE